jgi:hypothetical protein
LPLSRFRQFVRFTFSRGISARVRAVDTAQTPSIEPIAKSMSTFAGHLLMFDPVQPPPLRHDNDDNEERALRQEVIAERLAVMLGCVDTGPTNTEPEVFAPMMATHVYDANIHYPALLSGCKEIEEGQKPVRSIGYVLEILKKHQFDWWNRHYAINNLPRLARELEAKIERARRKFQMEQVEQRLLTAQNETGRRSACLLSLREGLTRLQDAARESYQQIGQAFEMMHVQQRRCDEAEIELREAEAALAAVQQKALAAVQQKALPTPKGTNGDGTSEASDGDQQEGKQ